MTLNRRFRRFARLLAVASLMTATACQNPGPAEPDGPDDPPGMASLAIRADVSGTSVEVLVVEVTAADIPEPFVFNIPVVNRIGSGRKPYHCWGRPSLTSWCPSSKFKEACQ